MRWLFACVLAACASLAGAQTVNVGGTVGDANTSSPFLVTVTKKQTITIGQTAIGPTADSGNANLLIASHYVLPQTATVLSMSFYVTAADGQLQLGIYDATGAGGRPGNKVAETAAFTPVVGWNTKPVVAQVSLPAGDYWLAYFPSAGALSFVNDGSGNSVWRGQAFGEMPSSFGVATDNGAVEWSLYATLDVAFQSYTVAVSASPTNGGTVSGGGTFPLNSQDTVTAIPAAGFVFSSWTEGGSVVATIPSYTFSVNQALNVSIVANFVPAGQQFTVTTTVKPPGACPGVTGAGTYPAGTRVTVTAPATC